jgi:hypothetical protein
MPPAEKPTTNPPEVVVIPAAAHVPAAVSIAVAEPSRPPQITSGDPRIPSLERRIDDNDWRGIATELGTLDEVGTLPPTLGLLSALAHHEASDERSHEAMMASVRCVAALMSLPDDSKIAGVIARRLLRKNPVRFRDRRAPTARASIAIMVVTLLLGGTAGWLLSGGWTVVHALLRAR